MIPADSVNNKAPLGEGEIRDIIARATDSFKVAGKRVLVVVPDSTRTAPVPLIFNILQELLHKKTAALDYCIALGTHPAMDERAIDRLVGMPLSDRIDRYPGTRIFNHRWDDPFSLATIGLFTKKEMEELSGGMLSLEVPIMINRIVLNYDRIIVFGPVFPHEVAGFSGGTKYFFPGISGPDMINVTHWLGALVTCPAIIGLVETPVRRMIDAAAKKIDVPVLFLCGVVDHGSVAGLFAGEGREPWLSAAALSEKFHIAYVEKPFRTVVSIMPEMYDDIWTAAKGMYKLEPVVADDGEVIIYAPHISEISYTHGTVIEKIGYHVRDYFVRQWDDYKSYPWGVLAHSTHVRGAGTYENGVEKSRIRVTLATGITEACCRKVNLGYRDPDSFEVQQLLASNSPDVLVVPRAGETLFRLAC